MLHLEGELIDLSNINYKEDLDDEEKQDFSNFLDTSGLIDIDFLLK